MFFLWLSTTATTVAADEGSQLDSVKLTSQTALNLSFAQTSVSDWKEGEKSTLDIKAGATFRYSLSSSWIRFTPTMRILVGIQKEQSELFPEGLYKATDNEMFAEGVLVFPLGWQIDPFISANFRTQVTESYRLQNNKPLRTAKLWDPVTSQESLGFTVVSRGALGAGTMRLGITLQQVRAELHTEQTDDRLTRGIIEQYKASSGIEWVGESQLMLDSNIAYNGRMSLRSTFDNLDTWSVLSENELRIRVWKFIGIIITANLTYNREQSIKTQFRQSTMLSLIQEL